MFNFFHECKSSPPHYLRSARTLVGKLAVIWKQCPDMWGLGLNLRLWYTNWNVWYVYTQLDKISARYCQKEVLYEAQCLKSTEDMILALAGQFKQLSHEPEKLRWLNGIRTHDLCDCLRHMEIVLSKVALSGRIELLLSFFKPLIHVHALSPVFEDKDSHLLASCDIGILKYIKHVVFVSTIVEKISFLCQKRFHYFGLLLFKNAVLQHQVHEWWYLNTDTCAAWSVIAVVRIVGYNLNEMINL